MAGLRPLPCLSPTQSSGKRPRPQHGGFCLVHDGHRLGMEHRRHRRQTARRSEKARERARLKVEGYALITAQNAATAVE